MRAQTRMQGLGLNWLEAKLGKERKIFFVPAVVCHVASANRVEIGELTSSYSSPTRNL